MQFSLSFYPLLHTTFAIMKCQAVVFAVLALCLQQGFGLKCWVCRSDIDPLCGDPFDNSTMPLSDCNQEKQYSPGVTPMCGKTIEIEKGTAVVKRSCTEGQPFSQSELGEDDTFLHKCNNKDGCNTATDIIPSTLLTMCVVTALILFKQ